MTVDFEPARGLRNAHVQSVLASNALRRWPVSAFSPMVKAAREQIVHCADGTRLQGFYSPQPEGSDSRGMVILLHGWEGCHASTYLLRTGHHLYGLGFDVFRLNLRDHGESHGLNEELFHSCRIDEVVLAVTEIAAGKGDQPLFLAGFSLGGNFALRVALRAPAAGIDLRRVIAVSPVISPHNALEAIETGPGIYHTYFIRKWRDSLLRKQALFPDRYDMSQWLARSTIRKGLRALTEHMVLQHTDFPTIDDYLSGYSIAGKVLSPLEIPATVITSRDDPIIPVADYHGLPENEALEVQITRFGGHCGFVQNWRLRGWIEREVGRRLLLECGREQGITIAGSSAAGAMTKG